MFWGSPKEKKFAEICTMHSPEMINGQPLNVSVGTQHTSDNHLNGYFSLHRLFLWAIKTYPELQQKIDDRLAVSAQLYVAC